MKTRFSKSKESFLNHFKYACVSHPQWPLGQNPEHWGSGSSSKGYFKLSHVLLIKIVYICWKPATCGKETSAQWLFALGRKWTLQLDSCYIFFFLILTTAFENEDIGLLKSVVEIETWLLSTLKFKGLSIVPLLSSHVRNPLTYERIAFYFGEGTSSGLTPPTKRNILSCLLPLEQWKHNFLLPSKLEFHKSEHSNGWYNEWTWVKFKLWLLGCRIWTCHPYYWRCFFFCPPRLMFYIHPYTLFFLRKLRKPAWLNLY